MKESSILKTILDGLAAHRIFAIRMNSAAFKVENRFVRANSAGRGCADILAFPRVQFPCLRAIESPSGKPGLRCGWLSDHVVPCWIEVKSDRGRQSPEQKSFEIHVRSQGHDYLLVRSWEEVENWLKEHGL
jgi:hypothetical protein